MSILWEDGKTEEEMDELRKSHPDKYVSKEAYECLSDKHWRVNHLYKIRDKEGKIITFKMNPEQEELFRMETEKDDRLIVLKARQLGITTFYLIMGLDDCLFNNNFNCGVIAHDWESMEQIFSIAKLAWDLFPENMKSVFFPNTRETKSLFEFDNRSKLRVGLSFRSGTLSRLHVSELGKMARKFPERAKEVLTGSFPAAEKGVITVESTAEGIGGTFHHLWINAPGNGFKKVFFDWTKRKEYESEIIPISKKFLNLQRKYKLNAKQVSWYYWKYKQIGEEVFQEFPLSSEMAFIQSGRAYFEPEFLFISCNPEKPLKGRHYVIGADVATGKRQDKDPDRSSLDVIDWETGNQVCHWAGICTHDEFAVKLYTVSKRYNNAIIGCERNNHGIVVIRLLADMGAKQHKVKVYHNRKVKKVDKLGWETNRLTKPLIISELGQDLREGTIGINNQKTIDELLSYETKPTGELGAVDGCHDDRVMSLAIANRMRKEHPPKSENKKNKTTTKGTFEYELAQAQRHNYLKSFI